MNSLKDMEKNLRSIAKRYRTVRFSTGLAVLFLMLGINAFAEEAVTEAKAMTRPEIGQSLEGMAGSFERLRAENNKLLSGAKLELIQLMEQGDQVVKSPWSSWQFGLNYVYANGGGHYKGRGDKSKKYPYEGIFTRAPWWVASVSEYSKNFASLSTGSVLNSAATTQRKELGETGYGFIKREIIVEKPVEMKLQASVTPRTVDFTPLNLTPPTAGLGAALDIPAVDIPVFSPKAPTIIIPSLAAVPEITTPGAGGGNDGRVGFWYADGAGEPDGHAVMSEIDILQGTIEGTFNDNNSVNFKVSNFKIQKGNNGQSTISFGGMPLTGAPYTKAYNPSNSVKGRTDQAIIKHVDTAVARYKAKTKIIATNNVLAPNYGKQILHYDEHYANWSGKRRYTLDELVANNFITEADKEAWKKYLNMDGTHPTHTTSTRHMQMVENAGDWYLRGHKIMAVNLQAHSGSAAKNSIFRNIGSITGLNEASEAGYLGEHVAFMFTEGDASQEHRGFDNVGEIEMRAPLSVIFHHDAGSNPPGASGEGADIMMNSEGGSIKLYGQKSAGYTGKLGSRPLDKAILRLENPITLLGDQNIGAVISKKMLFDKFVLKFDIGTENPRQAEKDPKGKDGLENSGNVNYGGLTPTPAEIELNKKNSLLTNNSTGLYSKYAGDFVLKDFGVNLGKYAKDSAGLRIDGTNMTIGDTAALHDAEIKNFIRHTGNYVDDKTEVTTTGNILAYVGPGNSKLTTSFDTEFKAEDSKKVTALLIMDSTKVVNKAKIDIKNSPESKGIVVHKSGLATPDVENYNDIILTGKDGLAVVNFGKFVQNEKGIGIRTKIEVEGNKGIGIYTKSSVPLELNSVDITAKDGALALYADGTVGNKSVIKLKDSHINVGENGLLSFNYTGTGADQVGEFELVSDITATIGKGAVAFYNRGTIADIPTYLNMLKGGKHLKLTLKDGARLFVLDDPNSVFNLSSLPTAGSNASLQNANNNVTVDVTVEPGADYKYYTANGGTLNVDVPVDLSNANDNYFKNDIMSASVNITKPITNNGQAIANGTKYAVAQKNAGLNPNKVKIKVDEDITLTGVSGLAGVVVDRGIIENHKTVTVTGDKGIGLLGSNGSLLNNYNKIIIGDEGIGILGLNKLTPTSSADEFTIDHVSTIKYQKGGAAGKAAYGIAALNNDGATTTYASKVTLGAESSIDLADSENGIGVLLKGTHITFRDHGSNIKVGKKGRGIHIDTDATSTLDVFGGLVEANGDEAIGVYSKTDLASVKNIKVSGKKSIGYFSEGNLLLAPTTEVTVADSTGTDEEKTIGIYGKKGIDLATKLDVGKKSIGVYKTEGTVIEDINLTGTTTFDIDEGGLGVYGEKAKIALDVSSIMNIKDNGAVGVYATKGSEVRNSSTNLNIGKNSFGFVLDDSTYTSVGESINLDQDNSIFIYAKKGTVQSIADIHGTGNKVVGIYGVNGSTITANNNIDLSAGKGNIGIYSEGGSITHTGNITVGASILDKDDDTKSSYAIGLAGAKGAHITTVVDGTKAIRITGDNGIGIYGTGAGTEIENHRNIVFDPNGKVKRMIGMFLNDGAVGKNYGDISTAASYSGNTDVEGLVGIAVLNSTLENHGNITIDADKSFGLILNNAIVKNYGNIQVNGKESVGVLYNPTTKGADGNPVGNEPNKINTGAGSVTVTGGATNYESSYIPDKTTGDIEIKMENGKLVVKRDGKVVPDSLVNLGGDQKNLWFSNVGLYVDTLGRTKPIEGTGFNPAGINDLIIGAEAADMTNNRNVRVGSDVMKRFTDWMKTNGPSSLDIYSGSLTWTASYDDNSGEVVMAKIDYKEYAKDKKVNEYNFLDGLEQRYGMNAIGSREKQVFNKLNSIGKNEGILLTQAFDEMMGHQYANVQQRIQATGSILDQEFKYLKKEWDTKSKDSNKIKAFGMRGEYNTDTAGIIDYTSHAQGFAYLHENETVQLGNTTGWYTGLVHNEFKFKDIGKSKEEMLQAKLGVFKSTAFDHNNSLNWTISGEMFVGRNRMNRRYLVVDDIFHAKSRYWTYGLALTNEVSKSFRTSESTFIKPYGELKLEYGRFQKIQEKDGEVRLEVKANDYYSVKPEVGVEAGYKYYLSNRGAFTAKMGVAYSNELGQVAKGKNKARVAYTNADWFNIRGEKEDRRGNLSTDLNLGWDNEAYGVTANIGYDTKGQNVRGGLGLRVTF